MKKIIKCMILSFAVLTTAILFFSCATIGQYDEYDNEGYTVSVKYDANGGMFTTNVEVIVDSYKLDDLPTNANGKKVLALLAPDDTQRGTGNAFKASKTGYFLAGWYSERNAVCNGNGEALDIDGNVAAESGQPIAYTYAGRWDFETDTKELDPNATYTSNEPITLYAAWIPEFKFEFYSLDTKAKLGDYTFDPNYVSDIKLPVWNVETGKLDMKNFPTVKGETLDGVFLDAEGTIKVDTDAITHTGDYEKDTATAKDPVMKLYLDYKDGEWFKILTAAQFLSNASSNGCYDIQADLDFEGKAWPSTFMYGMFSGTINGNGHIFKNIKVEPTDAKRINNGMFGSLTSAATVKDVAFENVTLTINQGTIAQDVTFGLFAGTIDANAKIEGVTIQNSAIMISSGAEFLSNTSLGLFCGVGSTDGIDLSGIKCEVFGEGADKWDVQINGNDIILKSAT